MRVGDVHELLNEIGAAEEILARLEAEERARDDGYDYKAWSRVRIALEWCDVMLSNLGVVVPEEEGE